MAVQTGLRRLSTSPRRRTVTKLDRLEEKVDTLISVLRERDPAFDVYWRAQEQGLSKA